MKYLYNTQSPFLCAKHFKYHYYWSLTSPNEHRLECFVGVLVEVHSLNLIIAICGLLLLWKEGQEVAILDSLDSRSTIWLCRQESLECAHGQWLMSTEGKNCEHL